MKSNQSRFSVTKFVPELGNVITLNILALNKKNAERKFENMKKEISDLYNSQEIYNLSLLKDQRNKIINKYKSL